MFSQQFKRTFTDKELTYRPPSDLLGSFSTCSVRRVRFVAVSGTLFRPFQFSIMLSCRIRFPFAQWQAAACFPPLAHQAHSGSCSTAARAVCIILPLELLSCFNQAVKQTQEKLISLGCLTSPALREQEDLKTFDAESFCME